MKRSLLRVKIPRRAPENIPKRPISESWASESFGHINNPFGRFKGQKNFVAPQDGFIGYRWRPLLTVESGGSTQLVWQACAIIFTGSCLWFGLTVDPLQPLAVLRNESYIRIAREKVGLPIERGLVYSLENGDDGLMETQLSQDEGLVMSRVPKEQFKELIPEQQ